MTRLLDYAAAAPQTDRREHGRRVVAWLLGFVLFVVACATPATYWLVDRRTTEPMLGLLMLLQGAFYLFCCTQASLSWLANVAIVAQWPLIVFGW